jgi:hypothetical protein
MTASPASSRSIAGKLQRAAEPHAARLSPLPTFAGTGFDKRSLELGETSQDRQHQHP